MDLDGMSAEHYVYIVRCRDGTLYTGYTNNVPRRIAAHNAGKGGRYTRSHRPVTLVAIWVFTTKGEALQVERQIKSLSRAQKLQLLGKIPVSGAVLSLLSEPSSCRISLATHPALGSRRRVSSTIAISIEKPQPLTLVKSD
jgi:putative endonuclease